jgi:hypothetical protein
MALTCYRGSAVENRRSGAESDALRSNDERGSSLILSPAQLTGDRSARNSSFALVHLIVAHALCG